MIPLPSLAAPELPVVPVVFFLLLVPLAWAGLALINAGLGRSRSAAHSMMASLCVIAVACGAYFVCGFAWQGYAGGVSHTFLLGGVRWSWLGAAPLFLRGVAARGSAELLAAWFGMFAAVLAALVPLGSGADRWRLRASCISTALLAGWTYPLFAHWTWEGGWLAGLGVNYGLGRGFLDVGGSGSIQAVGGLTALAVCWILGPRRGKYSLEGMPSAIPGHNAVYVLFGCILALVGWLGLNSAGAVLFANAGVGRVPLVAINTVLAAAASAGAAAVITGARFGKPDASITANGWVGGLAASSAACAFVEPAEAIVIGAVAGALVVFSVEWLELRLGVDDPGGAVSVHAVGGLWGVLALGFFARFPAVPQPGTGGTDSGQLLAQVIGMATLVGLVLPLSYGLNWLLNRLVPQRVPVEGERRGMDLYELGAGAYPEFVTHTDEFTSSL